MRGEDWIAGIVRKLKRATIWERRLIEMFVHGLIQ